MRRGPSSSFPVLPWKPTEWSDLKQFKGPGLEAGLGGQRHGSWWVTWAWAWAWGCLAGGSPAVLIWVLVWDDVVTGRELDGSSLPRMGWMGGGWESPEEEPSQAPPLGRSQLLRGCPSL